MNTHTVQLPQPNTHNTTMAGRERPTQTQREALAIARDNYAEIGPALTGLIDGEYQALKRTLDAAGVPWTPGRGVLTPN